MELLRSQKLAVERVARCRLLLYELFELALVSPAEISFNDHTGVLLSRTKLLCLA